MSLRNIGVVYRKEMVDSLRDRRTVISMFVIPILLFPALSVGLGLLGAKHDEQGQRGNSPRHDRRRAGLAADRRGPQEER